MIRCIVGEPKKKQKFWNNETKAEFFESYKQKATDESKSKKRIIKISVPHSVDVTDLLDASKQLISWSYDPHNKYVRYKEFPEYLKRGMHESTFSGTCWKLAHGCKKRSKLPPDDPFILVYGRCVAQHASVQSISLMYERGLVFPAPPDVEGIRWVVIWKDHIDYHIRPRIHLVCDNISNLLESQGVCVIPRSP